MTAEGGLIISTKNPSSFILCEFKSDMTADNSNCKFNWKAFTIEYNQGLTKGAEDLKDIVEVQAA